VTTIQPELLRGSATASQWAEGDNTSSNRGVGEERTLGVQPGGEAVAHDHRYDGGAPLSARGPLSPCRRGGERTGVGSGPERISPADPARCRWVIATAIEFGLSANR
jgi:hypothetical protein